MANNKALAARYENLQNANMWSTKGRNRTANVGGVTANIGSNTGVATTSTTGSTSPYMDAYNNGIKQNINSNYDTQLKNAEAAKKEYMASEDALKAKHYSDAQSAYEAYRKRAETEQNQSLDKTNAGYDASAKQNYINYMQAQKNLPSQLNALGIRGGASESSAIRLGTNYGSNVAANESARNTALAALRQQYEKALFDAEAEYKQGLQAWDEAQMGRISSYNDTYLQNVGQINAKRADALTSAYTTAKENDLAYKKEKRAEKLEDFRKTIAGKFKTRKGYLDYIKRLKNGNDPDKEMKIWYARQAMNQLPDDKGSGGSGSSRSYGGGGGYSSYGGGGGYGDDDNNNTTPKSTPTITHSSQSSAYGGSVPSSTKTSSSNNKGHRAHRKWWL